MRWCLRTAVLVLFAALAPLAHAVPSQFIAKQFSEALGRAPDTAGWLRYLDFFAGGGCSRDRLKEVTVGFFASAEYAKLAYSPPEMVLTAYRAILSREPDPEGFRAWTARLAGGATIAQVASELAGSPEFAALAPAICNDGAYRTDWGNRQAIDIGGGTWTQAQLQACIDNNTICSVPPRTVVFLDATLDIPVGHVLQTSGKPDHRHYARQARLVRNKGSFQHLLNVHGGGAVQNIWLSGQRHLFKQVPKNLDVVHANIWYGNEPKEPGAGLVNDIRSDFPLVRSHIVSVGPGNSLSVQNSLLTGYTSVHSPDGTESWIADGISQHASNGTMRNNDIIDPTDVGIVIFGHGPRSGVPQATSAIGNTIVHAGHSAYGSLGFDTTGDCVFCRFTGSIAGNTILAGPGQHSDVMLFVGTGPWTPAGQTNCGTGAHCGVGARMTNNRTLSGDVGRAVTVQAAMIVDGMLSAVTSGNTLHVNPRPLGKCYRGGSVVNDLGNAHAGGTLQQGTSHSVDGCIAPH
jgi:hypothetical protein